MITHQIMKCITWKTKSIELARERERRNEFNDVLTKTKQKTTNKFQLKILACTNVDQILLVLLFLVLILFCTHTSCRCHVYWFPLLKIDTSHALALLLCVSRPVLDNFTKEKSILIHVFLGSKTL